MEFKEAIILAGGLGTRLRDTIPGLPKCMAPVAGRPFLFYVINYLRMQGVERFIFSLGYKNELVAAYLADEFPTLNYSCSIESEPLGTGGAIRLACQYAVEENVVVANADTIFKIDLSAVSHIHQEKKADCTLAVKPMKDFERYGTIELDDKGWVTGFKEKQYYSEGLINGGIYILNCKRFLSHNWPEKFSFEKEYLEQKKGRFAASIQQGYFIDIGIPEDYSRAQKELASPPLKLDKIDKTWTIFIDRDGVINPEKKEDYIRNKEEFRFYEGVEEAFSKISDKFGKVIIISNQRGVGRALMTEGDLAAIHRHLESQIASAGGRVDKIYYCTATDNKDPYRKPNPGMARLAMQDFGDIDPAKCIMIGNKSSDMRFARNAGIYSVFVATTNPDIPYPHPDIDLRFNSLPDFVDSL
jgi:D-glycero-alpha-D-manno-heptose 1-phosphate guanylyltransferase